MGRQMISPHRLRVSHHRDSLNFLESKDETHILSYQGPSQGLKPGTG